MKVLITGGNSALAFKLVKAFTNDEVVLADYGDMPSIPAASCTFLSLGKRNAESVAHLLLKTALDEQVDVLLPLYAFEMEALAKASLLLEEFNVQLALPEVGVLSDFLQHEAQTRPANWMVCLQGSIIFSTLADARIEEKVRAEKLSGAFYLNSDKGDVANLHLITI